MEWNVEIVKAMRRKGEKEVEEMIAGLRLQKVKLGDGEVGIWIR